MRKTIFVLIGVILLVWGCEEFFRRKIGGFAGSYPYVESWEMPVSESELIAIIKEVKTTYPQLQIPGDTALTEGRESYWYHIKFYYPDTKEVVYTWTRPTTEHTAILALVGFSAVNNPASTKFINRDYWYLANMFKKIMFEQQIVNKIKIQIEKRKKNGLNTTLTDN